MSDLYLAERSLNANVEERLSDAGKRRLIRSLKPPPQRVFAQKMRWLSCEVGYRLVSAGVWLDEKSSRLEADMRAASGRNALRAGSGR